MLMASSTQQPLQCSSDVPGLVKAKIHTTCKEASCSHGLTFSRRLPSSMYLSNFELTAQPAHGEEERVCVRGVNEVSARWGRKRVARREHTRTVAHYA